MPADRSHAKRHGQVPRTEKAVPDVTAKHLRRGLAWVKKQPWFQTLSPREKKAYKANFRLEIAIRAEVKRREEIDRAEWLRHCAKARDWVALAGNQVRNLGLHIRVHGENSHQVAREARESVSVIQETMRQFEKLIPKID